jgi:DNA-binding winged helix-turn-helix (wHTH) protein
MAHGDRSVDVFVRKLRQKLQRYSGNWNYIHTHFGIGYRFDPEALGGDDAGVPRPAGADAEPVDDPRAAPVREGI